MRWLIDRLPTVSRLSLDRQERNAFDLGRAYGERCPRPPESLAPVRHLHVVRQS
jgi:hypothetical protein